MNKLFYSEIPLSGRKGNRRIQKTLLRMKLTGLLIVVSMLAGYGSTKGQISLQVKNTKVEQVLHSITKQTGVRFVYEKGILANVNTTVNLKDQSLKTTLDKVFQGGGFTYSVLNNSVVIRRNDDKRNVGEKQQLQFSGKVVDADGEPLSSVTVNEVGTSNSTQTDANGNFTLVVSKSTAQIDFKLLGYTTKRVSYSTGSVSVTLVSQSEEMDEVVVVGFGQQKKVSVVGAISTVSSKDLKVPTSTLSNAFAGRIAGVVAVQRGGEPGADGSSFWIRGISTFAGNTSPLIFIDGIESSEADLNNLASEVIDNFSVLKDASATALYGARGANGVLLVTTKRGGDFDKARLNFRVDNTFSAPTQQFELANAVDYMNIYNYAILNRRPNATPIFSQEKIDGTAQNLDPVAFPNVNWREFMFKDFSVNQYANLNIAGGGKKADYFLSATFNNDNGNLKSDPLKKFNNNIRQKEYNMIANIGVNITENTNAVIRLNSQLRDYGGSSISSTDIYTRLFESPVARFLPYYEAQPGDEHIRFGNSLGGPIINAGQSLFYNPYADMVKGNTTSFSTSNIASFEVNQKLGFLLEGLTAKGLISFKNYSYTAVTRSSVPFFYAANPTLNSQTGGYDITYQPLSNGNTSLSTSTNSIGDRLMNINLVVDWARSFGKHDVSAMAAYLQRDYGVNNPLKGPTTSEYWNTLNYRNHGVAGRVTYAYDLRYLFEANFGYNGSENFEDGDRYGFFPSFAAGYLISNEAFWTPIKPVISSLKFRGSWGLVGNDQIEGSRFPYLDKVTQNALRYKFGQTWQTDFGGAQINTYGAKGAQWELGSKYNVGLDITIANNLTINADYFTETRSDIFMQRRVVPAETGIVGNSPFANIGKVKNSGFDANLSYNRQVNENFFMNLRGTFTYTKNELLERDEPILPYAYLTEIGKPLNRYFGYISDGLYKDQADIDNSPTVTPAVGSNVMPGDIKYKDLNNDGKLDANDRMQFGNPTVPQIVYGFGSSNRYKNFDFSFFFQGVAKTSIQMSNIHPFTGKATNLLQFIADDYWREDNPNAMYPRLVDGVSDHNNFKISDYWTRDGSFLRLKNAELGYNYKKARFYLSGQNLLTFSKFKNWDPELGSGNGLKYPNLRVYAVGVQLSL